jgi:hypothetical protein
MDGVDALKEKPKVPKPLIIPRPKPEEKVIEEGAKPSQSKPS